jgi:hypothetical protein
MKHQIKLSQEKQQQQAVEHQTQPRAAREFANAEELLRHDAAHTTVPPVIAQRLQKSTGQTSAPPPRSWWRNLLGG